MGDVPLDSFICSITCDVMDDPVSTIDGQTYERGAIEQWFRNRNTSPLTGALLDDKRLIPNISLRNAIEEWRGCVTPTMVPLTTVDSNSLTSNELEDQLDQLSLAGQPQSAQSAQQLSELSTKELNRLCVNHQTGDCVIFKFQGEFSRSPMSLMRDTNYRLLCHNCQKMIWTDFFDDLEFKCLN